MDLLNHSFEGFNTCIFACESGPDRGIAGRAEKAGANERRRSDGKVSRDCGIAWEAVNADTGVSNSGKSCKYEPGPAQSTGQTGQNYRIRTPANILHRLDDGMCVIGLCA